MTLRNNEEISECRFTTDIIETCGAISKRQRLIYRKPFTRPTKM